MRFTYVTIFANLIEGYFQDSILKLWIESGTFSVISQPKRFQYLKTS
jgi:tRNA G37 N-methylase TrmD